MGQLLLLPVARQTEHAAPHGIADLVVQADLYVIFHTQLVKEADVLEGAGDSRTVDLDRVHAVGILAINEDGAPGGLVHLGQQVKDRGLARAVGTDESGDLGPSHREIEVIDGGQSAEINAQVAALQDGGLIDVPLRHDGVAGHRHHFGSLSLFQSAHFAAPFLLILPSSRAPCSFSAKNWRIAALLVAIITRMRTTA